jgi:hypothetical protein
MFLDEVHAAFWAFTRLVLHHIGVHRTGVLFGLSAALLLCRFAATAHAENGESEKSERSDRRQFAGCIHGVLFLLS